VIPYGISISDSDPHSRFGDYGSGSRRCKTSSNIGKKAMALDIQKAVEKNNRNGISIKIRSLKGNVIFKKIKSNNLFISGKHVPMFKTESLRNRIRRKTKPGSAFAC
jgi:hypothetical protein